MPVPMLHLPMVVVPSPPCGARPQRWRHTRQARILARGAAVGEGTGVRSHAAHIARVPTRVGRLRRNWEDWVELQGRPPRNATTWRGGGGGELPRRCSWWGASACRHSAEQREKGKMVGWTICEELLKLENRCGQNSRTLNALRCLYGQECRTVCMFRKPHRKGLSRLLL